MANFFAMGGYAVFVWPAYAVTLAITRELSAAELAAVRSALAGIGRSRPA